jgi:hypothetical protein
MFSECANPSCRVEFNYRQGQFFRFRKQQLGDGQPANTHSVQHFWLCGSCARTYRLEYEIGRGVVLKPFSEYAIPSGRSQLIGVV